MILQLQVLMKDCSSVALLQHPGTSVHLALLDQRSVHVGDVILLQLVDISQDCCSHRRSSKGYFTFL